MKKLIVVLFFVVFICSLSINANAESFDFDVNDSNGSGIKNWKWEWNGSGSATLYTNIIGNSEKAMEANTNRTTFTHTVTGSGARYLVITITDNVGNITKYPIKMYIDRNAPAKPTISAVLNKRIKLFYGDESSLSIDSEYGSGTVVRLCLKFFA